MVDLDLDLIKRTAAAATPGLWQETDDGQIWAESPAAFPVLVARCVTQADAACVTTLYNANARLVALVEQLRTQREAAWAELAAVRAHTTTPPPPPTPTKLQAQEWWRDSTRAGRWYKEQDLAVHVNRIGWRVYAPFGTPGPLEIGGGTECDVLGQNLADLCLSAHGYLRWSEIAWVSAAHRDAAIKTFDWRNGAVLTPTTLPTVLAAVRALQETP